MRAADESIALDKEPQRQFRCLADSDPRRNPNLNRLSIGGLAQRDRPPRQVRSIMLESDPQSARQLAWAVRRPRDPSLRANRLDRADQNAPRHALGFRDDIQAMVDAINQIDVGVSRRPEDDPGSRSHAAC